MLHASESLVFRTKEYWLIVLHFHIFQIGLFFIAPGFAQMMNVYSTIFAAIVVSIGRILIVKHNYKLFGMI